MKNLKQIGKIQRLPLRAVWLHEAYDFTNWLEENIEALNECTGLSLQEAEREQSAGSFSVDLVAQNQDGRVAIIENQLTKSDHDHLGKLLTYLTLMQAEIAVWVVPEPRPEHTAVITWLNASSSADFYMVKVEAIQIGDSDPAPLFTLIAGPSAELKEVGHTQRERAERHDLRQQWWASLLEKANKVNRLHSGVKTPPSSPYASASTGVPGLKYVYIVHRKKMCVELFVDRGKEQEACNESIFQQLLANKTKIELEFGAPLEWISQGNRERKIRFYIDGGGYRSPQESWPDLQDALIANMEKLNKAFSPYIRQLNLGQEQAA